jgi:hypothetical protein
MASAHHLYSHFCNDMTRTSPAAAITIAIDSIGFIPQFWQYGQTRFINTGTHMLGQRLSKSCFELAHVDFPVAITVHQLQDK